MTTTAHDLAGQAGVYETHATLQTALIAVLAESDTPARDALLAALDAHAASFGLYATKIGEDDALYAGNDGSYQRGIQQGLLMLRRMSQHVVCTECADPVHVDEAREVGGHPGTYCPSCAADLSGE